MSLIYLSIAWVTGIYLGSKLGFPIWAIATGILPLLLIPFLSRYKTPLLLTGLCLFAFIGGNLYSQSTLPKIDEQHLPYYNDQGKTSIEGMVITEPESRDKALILQFSANKINTGNETKEISGKAIIRVSRYSDYHYGDIIRINGSLVTPPQFGDFDYRNYLAHQNIYSIIYYPKIEILERDRGHKAISFIYSLRNSLSQSLSHALPEPQNSLAQGILLGLRGDIPYSLMQTFSRTGTAHQLAISGLHLSIIIGMLLSAGIWVFGRRYSIYIWLALATIWLYAVLTGLRPPIVRGAIMGSTFLLAEFLGRQRSASTALIFAAAIMIGIEPQIIWDASFQLSFLAMAGLIFIFPHFQACIRQRIAASSTNPVGTAASLYTFVADSLAVTLAALLATWPVIAYHFGIVSLIALPANFFSLLAFPGIIITTALVSIAGLLVPLVAQIIGWIAWLFLSYLIVIVQIFDALPLSSIKLDSLPIWQVWCYYILLMVVMIVMTRRNQFANFFSSLTTKTSLYASNISESVPRMAKKWSVFSLLIAAILAWTAVLNMPDDKLHVSILNIGQGDAILIQTPNRQNILIDGGPSPQAINIELSKKLPFWDRTIDLMILTQPQADHVTGLVEILPHYKVKQVVESGITLNSFIYNQWLKMVKNQEIKYSTARAGQEMDLGNGITIEVLHPPEPLFQDNSDDINSNGLVLRLDYNSISFLFTADIDAETEWRLISQRANLKSTVLKVAHHGSRSSTSPELLAVATPEAAAVSVGGNNNFGHPHPEVTARLSQKLGKEKVFFTSEDGTIEFITDGNRLWVKTGK